MSYGPSILDPAARTEVQCKQFWKQLLFTADLSKRVVLQCRYIFNIKCVDLIGVLHALPQHSLHMMFSQLVSESVTSILSLTNERRASVGESQSGQCNVSDVCESVFQ